MASSDPEQLKDCLAAKMNQLANYVYANGEDWECHGDAVASFIEEMSGDISEAIDQAFEMGLKN